MLAERRNAAQVEQIRASLERYGEAFLAYLMLDGIDQSDPKISERFLQDYVGHYLYRDQLIDDQLEALGWAHALETFKAEHDVWPEELRFNRHRIWARCLDLYRVEERLGGVHAFFK